MEDQRSLSDELFKVTLNRDELQHALSTVATAQSDNEFNWIQFDFVSDGLVVLTSTNHSLSICSRFHAVFEGTHIFKVSGKELSEYIKHLPSTNVTLVVESGGTLRIKFGRNNAKFQLIQDASRFVVSEPVGGNRLRVKGKSVVLFLDTFKDLVHTDDTRFYANGSLMWCEKENGVVHWHALATDSVCLAKSVLSEGFEVDDYQQGSVLVPKKALDEMRKLALQNMDDDIHVTWSQETSTFSIKTEDTLLVSKTIVGSYPPYGNAIPKKISTSVTLSVLPLLETVRRVALFPDRKNNIINLTFADLAVVIFGSHGGQKEAFESVDLESPLDKKVTVSFNAAFLIVILNILQGPSVTFQWDDVNRPMKIISSNDRGLDVFYLLVPARF